MKCTKSDILIGGVFNTANNFKSTFPRFMRGGKEVTPKQLNAINKILIRLKDEGLDI